MPTGILSNAPILTISIVPRIALANPFSINGLNNISNLKPIAPRDIISHNMDNNGRSAKPLKLKAMPFIKYVNTCLLFGKGLHNSAAID
jgi:hypothetical protein